MPNNKILFLDLLTVPQKETFHDLSVNEQQLWEWKSSNLFPNETDFNKSYIENAGIYAEFGKIGGFAIGYQSTRSNDLRIKTYINEDEKELLNEIHHYFTTSFRTYKFCAHHGKEFDYPFLARRMVINKISLPETLKNLKSKPWNHPHLDTMDLWKFGDRKSFTPLSVLMNALGESSLPPIKKGELSNLFYTHQHDKLNEHLHLELNALNTVFSILKNC